MPCWVSKIRADDDDDDDDDDDAWFHPELSLLSLLFETLLFKGFKFITSPIMNDSIEYVI